MIASHRICPGCRLEMPRGDRHYDGYFNTSPECWSVFGEVIGAEFENVVLFSQAHQLSVDAYAVQHAGGPHPDKSVCVHLVGLHLALERGFAPRDVAPRLQRLASVVTEWPHLAPPEDRGALTVFDVAAAGSPQEHISMAREWAKAVWTAWRVHHAIVAELAERCFMGQA